MWGGGSGNADKLNFFLYFYSLFQGSCGLFHRYLVVVGPKQKKAIKICIWSGITRMNIPI